MTLFPAILNYFYFLRYAIHFLLHCAYVSVMNDIE